MTGAWQQPKPLSVAAEKEYVIQDQLGHPHPRCGILQISEGRNHAKGRICLMNQGATKILYHNVREACK